MSEEKKTEPVKSNVAPVTFKFDEKAALAKLDAVETTHKEFIGKKNYNPFFVLGKVHELRSAIKKGNTTEALAKDINELPTTPKPLDPNYKEPEVQRIIQAPQGLKLPDKR